MGSVVQKWLTRVVTAEAPANAPELLCAVCLKRARYGSAAISALLPVLGAKGTSTGRGYRRHLADRHRAQPVSEPPQLGCCSATPRLPQAVQRAVSRSMSCQPSGPHRMMYGPIATARMCGQRVHLIQHHVVVPRNRS